MNRIKIWNNHTTGLEHLKINISYVQNSRSISSFLSGDIQMGTENCLDWLYHVMKAKDNSDYFYDSFGNCCTTTVTHQGVTIENEYTGDIVKNISLDDMQIILAHWLEFIKTRNPIEYSW